MGGCFCFCFFLPGDRSSIYISGTLEDFVQVSFLVILKNALGHHAFDFQNAFSLRVTLAHLTGSQSFLGIEVYYLLESLMLVDE